VTLRASKLVVTFPNSTLIACVKATTNTQNDHKKNNPTTHKKTDKNEKSTKKKNYVRIKTKICKVLVGEKIEL
jgi:hypothetical protein